MGTILHIYLSFDESCKYADVLQGSVAKNMAVLQNELKTSQMGYLYAINRLIMI
jgi:hypothetical protein